MQPYPHAMPSLCSSNECLSCSARGTIVCGAQFGRCTCCTAHTISIGHAFIFRATRHHSTGHIYDMMQIIPGKKQDNQKGKLRPPKIFENIPAVASRCNYEGPFIATGAKPRRLRVALLFAPGRRACSSSNSFQFNQLQLCPVNARMRSITKRGSKRRRKNQPRFSLNARIPVSCYELF